MLTALINPETIIWQLLLLLLQMKQLATTTHMKIEEIIIIKKIDQPIIKKQTILTIPPNEAILPMIDTQTTKLYTIMSSSSSHQLLLSKIKRISNHNCKGEEALLQQVEVLTTDKNSNQRNIMLDKEVDLEMLINTTIILIISSKENQEIDSIMANKISFHHFKDSNNSK